MKYKFSRSLTLSCNQTKSLRMSVFFIFTILTIVLTNGFQPVNYQKKALRDCAAKMFRINKTLKAFQDSYPAALILGNGESIASYPQFLQLCGEDIPVCPLLESQDSGANYYSITKSSDSLEIRCFFHGTRSDYEAGKEVAVTEHQLQLIQQMASKSKRSFFANIILVNLIVVALLWLPVILMHDKPGKFLLFFGNTLRIHWLVLKIMLIAFLPAIIMASTNDDKAIITLTMGCTLLSFIIAKVYEMAFLPAQIG